MEETTLNMPPGALAADMMTGEKNSAVLPPAPVAPNEIITTTAPEDASLVTPTRNSFVEPRTPPQKRNVPSEPPPSLKRDGSTRSSMYSVDEGQDVEMGEGEEDEEGDELGSDNDSVDGDSERPSKKKKGQRFFCTDFPPCQLSFTRSEHLARHIRKHTGERPFQCHCSRRFSRLDNLRQHAQTVHVNEEIPGDSLAATSTRFQRQIRTDRVRPPTSRSRTSTMNSTGSHSRGHSRNLSTSSVRSTASSISVNEETRRRPQPLAMAHDPSTRVRTSLTNYNSMHGSPMQQQYVYYSHSPTGFGTPTSTSFSTGPTSPYFHPAMGSPASTVSRSSYYNGARQARRLSVPSGASPFLNQNGGNTYPPQMYYQPMPAGSPGMFSQGSSVLGSPTSSVFSHSRRDSDTDMEMRRRTWHPSTYSSYMQRPPTSGLSYQQTPDDQRSAPSDQPAASQYTRLPGIESFDHVPPTNARQPSDPMLADSSPRLSNHSARPSDAGLHQKLTRLDIAAANAPVEAQWHAAQQQQQQIAQQSLGMQHPATVAPQVVQPASMQTAESPVTPKKNRRQAWYGGPVAGPITPSTSSKVATRTSPEDSGSSDGVPTPGTSQVAEFHPVIVNLSGESLANAAELSEEQKAYVRTPEQPPQMYALQAGHDPRFAAEYSQPASNDMGRLEALVAVATSENRAAERS